jgi:hypothetical protein
MLDVRESLPGAGAELAGRGTLTRGARRFVRPGKAVPLSPATMLSWIPPCNPQFLRVNNIDNNADHDYLFMQHKKHLILI